MDILEESFGAETSPVNLDSLMEVTNLPSMTPGRSAVRNRAATTALLSPDPTKAIDNYQLMMQENESGQDLTLKAVQGQIQDNAKSQDTATLMKVLADPNIPFAQKQQVVNGIKDSSFLKDTSTILHTKNLAATSRGESLDNEAARISTADAIREIYDARTQVQGLQNAHAASLRNVSAETGAEMVELWMMPFGNSINAGKLANSVAGPQNLWNTVKNFLLPGTAVNNMREQLESLPPAQRVEYAKRLVEGIKNNSGVLFSSDNQFAQYEKASSIFEEGGYSDFQAFMDNVSPLLDVIGLGQAARGLTKGARAASKAAQATEAAGTVERASWELVDDRARQPVTRGLPNPQKRLPYDGADQAKRIEINAAVREENAASPASVAQNSNPQKARDIHATVVNSNTDEVAEPMYGVSREQAIINDVYPQAATETGRVSSKVADVARNLRQEMHVPDEVVNLVNDSGALYYTRGEKAQARANIVRDFGSAEGLSMNEAMSSFSNDGGRINIGAVYGTPNGSFSSAEDAAQQAKFALRNYGILDSEIEILRKEGLDHVPVKLDDVRGQEGDYLVRINTSHEIDPTDITSFEALDVKRNFFDRIGITVTKDVGSVSRHVFDAASMLHPTITGAATVASDQTARFDKLMLNIATDYSDKYTKLPKARKGLVDEYIREANFNGIGFDQTDLLARGFGPQEISAIKSWRDFWDAHFYLENYDVVRSLNSQGFQLYKDQYTELYAKPIAKNQNVGNIFDPAGGRVIQHTKAEGDALYAAGGTYARLRRPTDFGGVTAEYMLVRNNASQYLRKFRDSDQVLNYRPGYFQIQYTAPRFVDEVTRDANGLINSRRAVAVAGDTKEADFYAQRMAKASGQEYVVRSDDKAMARDSDSWWDVNSAGGRIAQKHRGKLLEDGSGLNHLGDGSYIINPVDSAIRAAKSISARTVNRPMLEAAKGRFMAQYQDYLPSNGMGGVRWPSSVKELGAKGESTSSKLADARTTYEYIKYLENGYINSIDNMFKAGMNLMADLLGKAHLSTAERTALWAAEGGPASLAKNGVFMAYIGSNVFRQWIVQPHQMLRTWFYNPRGWANGNVEKYMVGYVGDIMGLNGPLTKEMLEFNTFVNRSGLLDAVDKQNLIRGSLTDAADSTNKLVRKVGQGNDLLRKAGFDVGEMANMLGHSAAVYERYKRLGKDLTDKAVRDEAYSEIRAISYEMNFSGDMPYNQNAASVLLQFMQVPHKAMLQMSNRRIAPMDRLRMIGGDLVMWGTPVTLISTVLGTDLLPDDPKTREFFLWGLESMLLNNMFTNFSGEETNLDFSSLAPYEMSGWTKFFQAMYSGGFSQMLANSPAGQLFLKDGSRVQNAMSAMSRFFGIVEDDDETPETFISVMNEVLSISSGWNNAVKAKLLLDAKKKFDQYGNTIDQSVSYVEAWGQALGFGTSDVRDLYNISMSMSKDNKAYKDEVLKVYKDITRYYENKLNVESNDPKFITKVTGRAMKVFENDPVALGIIQQQLGRDLEGKESALLNTFMKRAQIPTPGNLRDQVLQAPVDDTKKQQMLKMIEDIGEQRKQYPVKER